MTGRSWDAERVYVVSKKNEYLLRGMIAEDEVLYLT
jgi:hypothetical protein